MTDSAYDSNGTRECARNRLLSLACGDAIGRPLEFKSGAGIAHELISDAGCVVDALQEFPRRPTLDRPIPVQVRSSSIGREKTIDGTPLGDVM